MRGFPSTVNGARKPGVGTGDCGDAHKDATRIAQHGGDTFGDGDFGDKVGLVCNDDVWVRTANAGHRGGNASDAVDQTRCQCHFGGVGFGT